MFLDGLFETLLDVYQSGIRFRNFHFKNMKVCNFLFTNLVNILSIWF